MGCLSFFILLFLLVLGSSVAASEILPVLFVKNSLDFSKIQHQVQRVTQTINSIRISVAFDPVFKEIHKKLRQESQRAELFGLRIVEKEASLKRILESEEGNLRHYQKEGAFGFARR